jgi:hypothetical protein
MNRLVILAALALASQARFLPAEESGVRYSLFNGNNLHSWVITGCEAGIEDGVLVTQKGDGFVRTEHPYRDFVLELDWKPRRTEKYDSGIYMRAPLPAEGKPWPVKHQINLKQGDEANLIGFPKARSQRLVKPGDWNHMKLTVIGDKATMELNGKPAWETVGLEPREGYVGIQVEEPGGGQFEFKNIWITELGAKPLFNGSDLAGWEGAGQDAALCWKVEDGLLTCTGKKGPWLRSLEQYGDFNLRLEYRLKPGGNSGVYVRVPKDGNHHGDGAGVEIQVLDDKDKRYEKLKDYQYTGSVYAVAPATKHVGRPAGEWNSLEIETKGSSYRVIHNGIEIVHATEADFPALAGRLKSGFLGLQNHSEEVWYRNVRIRADN